jgi:ADP-ribose pyrophosphatase YjhB (NUDIX family)
MNDADWLTDVKRLRAIAQTGLAYSKDPFDLERYQEVQGLAEQMLTALVDAAPGQIRDLYLPERGYPTPKVDVRAGVFRDDQILMVQERADGRWALPGGWADEHEPPRACMVREVFEESGYEVRVQRLVAVKDRHLHPYQASTLQRVYKLFFLCELVGGQPATSIETSAVGFFPVDRLPPLSLGRTIADDVQLLRTYRADPGAPCYID